MNQKFFFNYLIIIYIFFSCVDFDNQDNLETTTTGSDSETILIEIYYGVNNQEGQLSIANPNLDDVSGFQFDLTGASLFSGASGGLAEENNFSVQVGESTGTVLGVSFSGDIIPGESNGILTNVSVSGVYSNICIENVIFANQNAEPIDIIIGEYCIEY